MAHQDELYLKLLEDSIENGVFKADRTGVGSRSVFGRMVRYDLSQGRLPILTTKKMQVRSFIHEMLWFISGNTSIRYLLDNNVNIWNNWLIPGTERYEPLTMTEMHGALLKHFNVASLTIRLVPPVQLGGKENYAFIGQEDDPTKGVLNVSARLFSRSTQEFVRTAVHYQRVYQAVFEKPAEKLADGDIGKGGYGAQWRRWEDTRIVGDEEVDRYSELGYEKVVKIPSNNAWGKKTGRAETVMHRDVDQLAKVITTLSNDPRYNPKDNWNSRRIIVTAWNPGKLEDAALPPCHLYFQFFNREMTLSEMMNSPSRTGELGKDYVALLKEYLAITVDPDNLDQYETTDNQEMYFKRGFTDALRKLRQLKGEPWRMLSCLLLMRSNDLPLGHPFNIAQYGLLVHMIAQCCNMEADELIWAGADVHTYENQVDAAEEQLGRLPFVNTQPRVVLTPGLRSIDAFSFDDIKIEGYDEHWDSLYYPVAV